jgi:hypothetical protein
MMRGIREQVATTKVIWAFGMEPPFTVLHTPPFVHSQAAWSPFFDNRLAIATAANYGLVGNGKLQVASLIGGGTVPVRGQIDKRYVNNWYTSK